MRTRINFLLLTFLIPFVLNAEGTRFGERRRGVYAIFYTFQY